MQPELTHILSHYPYPWVIRGVETLGGAGGFSGARLWRVTADQATLCLRKWPPEYPSAQGLAFIHRVLEAARTHHLDYVPVPYRTSQSVTAVHAFGSFWEVTDWLPGVADFHRHPTSQRLQAAMEALARFHLAVRDVARDFAPSPSLSQRLNQTRQLSNSEFPRLAAALEQLDWPEFRERGQRLLGLAAAQAADVEQVLTASVEISVPLQPVIRDIWHDHLLWSGEQVTGVIDFGAVRCDTVAADLARLLGSLVGDDPGTWHEALQAYARVRPFSENEQRLLAAFDSSTVLLSGVNWIRWIALERRTFDDTAAVLRRMDEWLSRLA